MGRSVGIGRGWLAVAAVSLLAGVGLVVVPAAAGAAGPSVITSCDSASVAAAIEAGGAYTFGCGGEILIPAGLTLGAGVSLSLDATGETVTLLPSEPAQRFLDVEGGTLSLTDLTLSNFGVIGTSGTDGISGADGTAGTPAGQTGDPNGGNGTDGAVGSGGDGAQGGTLLIGSGTVTLSGVSVAGSSATGGGGGGGGIGGAGGWAGNSSSGKGGNGGDGALGADGGDALGGAIYNAGTLQVTGSTFSADRALGGPGGGGGWGGGAGVGFNGGSPGLSAPGGDGGSAQGGAIYNTGSLSLAGTTFSGDAATGGAGGSGGGESYSEGGGYFGPYGGQVFGQPGGVGTPGGDGGNGGNGGNGQGGGLYDAGHVSFDSETFISCSATGGAGGAGGTAGTGGENAGPVVLASGTGGNGGAGGDAQGPALVSATPIDAGTTYQANTVTAGAGGAAGLAEPPTGEAGALPGTAGLPGQPGTTSDPDNNLVSAPTVTGLSPPSGSLAGGTTITITGTGFGSQGATDTVKLIPTGGGSPIPATQVLVKDDSTITAVTGDATASLAAGQSTLVTDVEVTAASQTSPVNAPDDQFTYNAASITINPPTGSPGGGTTLTITGHGFGTTDVSVAFCPPGTTTPNTVACILGTSANGPPTDVAFPPDNDTTISVVDPAWAISDNGSAETVAVFVETLGAGTVVDSSSAAFTYRVSVSSVTTASGLASGSPGGGQTVTVKGAGFGTVAAEPVFCPPGTTAAEFATSDTVPLAYNAALAAGCHSHGIYAVPTSDTEVLSLTPPWTIGVGGAGSSEAVEVFVEIVTIGDALLATSAPYTFTYGVSVSSVTTASGLASGSPAGGQTVTIKGAGFGGAPGDQVDPLFCPAGTTAAELASDPEAFAYNTALTLGCQGPSGAYKISTSDTEILSVTPAWTFLDNLGLGLGGAGSSEAVEVFVEIVTTNDALLAISAPYSFTYGVSVSSISPPSDSSSGGTTLTLSGQGFGTPANKFGVEFCPPGTTTPTSPTCRLGNGGMLLAPENDTTVLANDPPWTVTGGSSETVAVFVQIYLADGSSLVGTSKPFNFTYVANASAPPCGTLQNCNGDVNPTPGGSASATSTSPTGEITATGQGTGGITVGRYTTDPVGTPTFNAAGSYFDVKVSSPNSFTSATIQDCDLGGGSSAQWWNPAANAGAGAWQPVTPETLSAGPPPCLTITVNGTSSPTLAQLTGTVFGIALPATGTAKPDVDLDTHAPDVKPGDTVTLHASVSGRHDKAKPTGTISFTDNGVPIAACTDLVLPASGKLTCTLSYPTTTGSPHHLVASYSGDATYQAGTATTTIRVTKIQTHLRLDASGNRLSVGQQVTYRATIGADQDKASPAPTGTLTFTDDGVAIPDCTNIVLNSSGPTTCTVTATQGTHHIKAVYSGDHAYEGSSATLTATVKPSGTQ